MISTAIEVIIMGGEFELSIVRVLSWYAAIKAKGVDRARAMSLEIVGRIFRRAAIDGTI